MFPGYFDSSHKFKPVESGFKIAATVSAFDTNPDPIEDERIGTIKFYIKSWSNAIGTDFGFKELDARPCSIDDFAKNDDDFEAGKFYPLRDKFRGKHGGSDGSEFGYEFYQEKMKCIDDGYELFGDYDSVQASHLLIVFELCDRDHRADCLSDDEIKEWMEFKYIFI